MKDGFVKVAAVTPQVTVADPEANRIQIRKLMKEAAAHGAKIIVFPELAITGYTCGDLFAHKLLLEKAYDELMELVKSTEEIDAIVFVGTPWLNRGKLYNCMAVMSGGELIGLVPKRYIPNFGEFYEKRYFESGNAETFDVEILDEEDDEDDEYDAEDETDTDYEPEDDEDDDEDDGWGTDVSCSYVPFGTNLIFACEEYPDLKIAGEICEDLWSPNPPGTAHARAGAVILVNCSASNEAVGKAEYRRTLIAGQSGRLHAAYVYANAGYGESTTDVVFGGHDIIAENGSILAESRRFEKETILYADIDVDKLTAERQKNTTFTLLPDDAYETVDFSLKLTDTKLEGQFPKMPFVPDDPATRDERCQEILMIQALGLVKRLDHTNCKRAVIGISGGLDSTLALLVTVKAFDILGLDRSGICAVTMPCFGTTDRTYNNACRMAESTGAKLMEVPIRDAVRVHFKDIGQDEGNHDVTYENAQARERTQVLMDIANQIGGMVIGTGDMSELALGWATYNGDHMSMYGVNGGVPKTLVRHLVRYYADTCGDEKLAATLRDVLDTPVSPELLPPEDGVIAQKTEDLVGPYELHDFFLYYMLRFGFPPRKIYRMALTAFEGEYDADTIHKWLYTFYRRFFSQQFKRSCLPDGPKVGSAAVSPRGDLKMPSDASSKLWLKQIEGLKNG